MQLFLSPHSDDAVLSCGGLIPHLVQQNETVTLLTVMGGNPPSPLPDTAPVRELHTRWRGGANPSLTRREEDRAAAHILGAAADHLAVPDCIYRSHLYRGALYPATAAIFGEVHWADYARYDAGAQVQGWLSLRDTAVDRIFVPLAVGHHVDHQIVRQIGLDLALGRRQFATPGYRPVVWFYADYPYCESGTAVQEALTVTQAQYTVAAASAAPKLLTEHRIHLNPDDYAAKCDAIAAYHSQISTFWESAEQMRKQVKQFMQATGNGQLAERYWSIGD